MNLKKIKDGISMPLFDINNDVENMIAILEAIAPDIAITETDGKYIYIPRPLTQEEARQYFEFTGHRIPFLALNREGWYSITDARRKAGKSYQTVVQDLAEQSGVFVDGVFLEAKQCAPFEGTYISYIRDPYGDVTEEMLNEFIEWIYKNGYAEKVFGPEAAKDKSKVRVWNGNRIFWNVIDEYDFENELEQSTINKIYKWNYNI